jgi:hypothetical protein
VELVVILLYIWWAAITLGFRRAISEAQPKQADTAWVFDLKDHSRDSDSVP